MSFLVEDQYRNMDHLDLAGALTIPSTTNWQIPAFEPSPFEQQDAIYLSSSRQMLEPIMEETSEDEESNPNSWTHYENNSAWSSESDTGSVIRIELNGDPDSISERDFACPAKRARRDEFIIGGLLTCQPILDESGHLRKYQRNDLLNTAIDRINSNETNSLTTSLSGGSIGQRKRFDEFYCDMDSISCNSLSRSSSLIQFESLERQLLNEQGLCSSLGNSSPSLLSFEGGCIDGGTGSGSNSNRGSTGCLKRYESSDGRLHQTYFDLDKIDFAENLHFTSTAANKSDSESSSDNSVASHKILSATGAAHTKAFLKGGKSSAENLSEDSGYCEHIHSVLRAKSKSIPNFENFCEEDEFYDHPVANSNELRKSHSKIQATPLDDAPKIEVQTVSSNGVVEATVEDAGVDDDNDVDDDDDEDEDEEEETDGDCWYNGDKNSRRSPSSSSPISSDESSATTTSTSESSSCASASSFTWRPAPAAATASVATISTVPTNKEGNMAELAPLHRSPNRSSSLPDIRVEETTFALSSAVGHHQQEQRQNQHYYCQQVEPIVFQSNSTERVASVPNDLDRIEDHPHQYHQHLHSQAATSNSHHHRQRRSSAQRRQPLLRRTLSDSSSSDLDEDQSEQSSVVGRSNSWKRNRHSTSAERLEATSQSVRSLHSISSGSGIGYMNASYSNLTLLDYSGQPRSNRNSLPLVNEEASGNLKRNSREMGDIGVCTTADPQDTEKQREDDDEGVHHVQLTIHKPIRRNNSKSKSSPKTFDQDPTCLKTSYAESLEKCNFDPKELSITDLTKITAKRRFHSAPKKRTGLVSSTPNLNAYTHEDNDDDMCVSSAHTSMQQLPTGEKRLGILLPAGSRSSFCKGVSFCPVVSKYSWQEQSSEECAETPAPVRANDATVIDIKETPPKESQFSEESTIIGDEEKNIEKTSPIEESAVKEKITITINSVIATETTAVTETNPPPSPPHNSISSSTKAPVVERGSDCYRFPLRASNNVAVNSYVAPVNKSPPRTIVLSASKKLFADKLDNPRPATPVPQVLAYSSPGPSDNISATKMSNYAVKCSASSGDSRSLNNNNELMKSKFKADEKHPQHKGFLSRFANGFRFSLRRNKKKQQQQQQQQKELKEAQQKQGQLPPIPPSSKKPMQNSPDFIYIPLKGSVSKKSSSTSVAGNGSTTTPCNNGKSSPSPSIGSDHMLNAKQQIAPFQKPPRVVGMCEKRIQSAGQHAPQNPGPQSIDEAFLENERSYYDFKNQLNGVLNGNGCNTEDTGPTMNNSSQHSIPAGTDALYHYQTQQQQQQQQHQQQLNHYKIGLIETNLDTHETKISGKTRSLMELGPQVKYNFSSKRNTSGYEVDDEDDGDDDDDGSDDVDGNAEGSGYDGNAKNIGVVGGIKKSGVLKNGGVGVGGPAAAAARRPHKSMEFLLDKENQKNILPPENELQKSHDNTTRLSEHQLRVQASLQRLNIPDWFRQYNHCLPKSPDALGYKPANSNFTRKRASESGRWTGLNSKTTSLSSLGSQRSDRSPLLLSPSAHSHHGGQTTIGGVVHSSTGGANSSGGFSRWSTSYLNSSQTSPSVSSRGSFSRGGPVNSSFISATSSVSGARSSFRQPYLGWRSQEKLSQPRTPHERLASSLLAQRSPKQEPVTPEIQTSIKEVTSAIVHYVNDQTNRTNQRSRSASPNSRN